jgi:hypothetical protein
MKNLKDNYKLGAILSVVGILTGLLVLFLLASIYQINIDGKIAGERPDEAITVQIVFALLSWLGASAGALWVAVLYGFINKSGWAEHWCCSRDRTTAIWLLPHDSPCQHRFTHTHPVGLPNRLRTLVRDALHRRCG